MGQTMTTLEEYLQRARQYSEQAKTATDKATAKALNELADEYLELAKFEKAAAPVQQQQEQPKK
jgi:hypothetical protein